MCIFTRFQFSYFYCNYANYALELRNCANIEYLTEHAESVFHCNSSETTGCLVELMKLSTR